MQFIHCMCEGCNRFRQHDIVTERIPHIKNTFSKGMIIANITQRMYMWENFDLCKMISVGTENLLHASSFFEQLLHRPSIIPYILLCSFDFVELLCQIIPQPQLELESTQCPIKPEMTNVWFTATHLYWSTVCKNSFNVQTYRARVVCTLKDNPDVPTRLQMPSWN